MYNALLRTIMNSFTGFDADFCRLNGNAFNQLRTNEVVLKYTAGCALPVVFPALCPLVESTMFPI
jgi:hypothetical protein